MFDKIFNSLVVSEINGKFKREIKNQSVDELPTGDVLIKVSYSSLNYKDALSATGNKGVTKQYPFTPGIDAAGVVQSSAADRVKIGDEVLVTGFDLGMNTPGGFGGYIRVPADWIIKLPANLSLKESMIFGTAGFTAALALQKIKIFDIKPKDGEVIVTGASGGVGSMAVALFSKLGYTVTAATGKMHEETFLRNIGAKNVVHRDELLGEEKKALLSSRWIAAVDTVGGDILSSVIAAMKYEGVAAVCGNAASFKLNTTVYPFILRGVDLLGINTEKTSLSLRNDLWIKLSGEWKPEVLELMYEEVDLEGLNKKIDEIMKGKIRGRVIIRHQH